MLALLSATAEKNLDADNKHANPTLAILTSFQVGNVLAHPPAMLGKTIRQKIDEQTDLRRQMASVRIDGANRELYASVIREQGDETACGQIVGHQEARREAHGTAVDRKVA